MLSSRGIAALGRNQICRNEHASPHDGQITPPLRGSRRSRAGPLSARPAPAVPELVEGPKDVEGAALSLSKGRRRLMWWGDFNAIPYARCMIYYECILRRSLSVRT